MLTKGTLNGQPKDKFIQEVTDLYEKMSDAEKSRYDWSIYDLTELKKQQTQINEELKGSPVDCRIKLPLSKGEKIEFVGFPLNHINKASLPECYVFPISGLELGKIYEKHFDRVFVDNVRDPLKTNKIHEGILKSLKVGKGDKFFFLIMALVHCAIVIDM